MAENKFIAKYLTNRKKSEKKQKTLRLSVELLEALEHNAKVLNVSSSTIIEDALIHVGMDKKINTVI